MTYNYALPTHGICDQGYLPWFYAALSSDNPTVQSSVDALKIALKLAHDPNTAGYDIDWIGVITMQSTIREQISAEIAHFKNILLSSGWGYDFGRGRISWLSDLLQTNSTEYDLRKAYFNGSKDNPPRW